MTFNPANDLKAVNDSSQIRSLLKNYREQISETDKLPSDDIRPILLGLFGEVGSVMATAKKLHREKTAYVGYQDAAEEEFGDALWYFTILCQRLGVNVEAVFADCFNEFKHVEQLAFFPATDASALFSFDDTLLRLGKAATAPGGHRNSPTCGHPKFPHP